MAAALRLPPTARTHAYCDCAGCGAGVAAGAGGALLTPNRLPSCLAASVTALTGAATEVAVLLVLASA
jgi:hypothetical protein